jgi:hypothetical protein
MTSVLVGQPYLPDGYAGADQPRVTNDGARVIQSVHGQYFEDARRGNLWTWSSGAAGITPLIYSSTTPAFVLWNQSTTRSLEIVEASITHSATGAAVAVSGNIGIGLIPAAGTAVGVPISAFTTLATCLNSRSWAWGTAPNGRVATASTIVALAATAYAPIWGVSGVFVSSTATNTPYTILARDFKGGFLIPPACAIVLCGNVSQTQIYGFTISWIDNVVY